MLTYARICVAGHLDHDTDIGASCLRIVAHLFDGLRVSESTFMIARTELV